MKVIIVYSGKGGVGKTTTTVNTARVLVEQGKKVFILDADVNTPSLGVIFKKEQPSKNLYVKSLGMEHTPIFIQQSMIKSYLSGCIKQINKFKPDYVLIDTPPSITDVHINLMEKIKVSGILMVTQPSDLSISDVNRTAVFFKGRDINVIGIVENMVTPKSQSNKYVWPTISKIPFADNFDMNQAYEDSKDLYTNIVEVLTNVDNVLLENRKKEIFDESIDFDDHLFGDPDSDQFYLPQANLAKGLKFINLKTWEQVKMRLQMAELHPDQLLVESTTERIKRLLDAFNDDDSAYFLITKAPNTEIALFPGEIGQCSLQLDDVHYGIPKVRYQTDEGSVTCFPHEVMPVSVEDLKLYTSEGHVLISGGRYIPTKGTLMEIEHAYGSRVGLLSNWEEKYNKLMNVDQEPETVQ